jgi:hypothetical protein
MWLFEKICLSEKVDSVSGMATIVDSEHGFTKVRVDHEFEVLDDSSTTFRSQHNFLVRAELRGRFFQRRYQWTGSDEDERPTLETVYDMWGHPQHNIHGPVIREGRWRIILVDLGRTLEIGDQDVVHFHHRLRDLNGKFQPFLGNSPKPGTKYITLKVILPLSLAHDVFYDERMLDTDNVIATKELQGVPVDGKVQFVENIPDPVQLNRGYRIRWTRQPR